MKKFRGFEDIFVDNVHGELKVNSVQEAYAKRFVVHIGTGIT